MSKWQYSPHQSDRELRIKIVLYIVIKSDSMYFKNYHLKKRNNMVKRGLVGSYFLCVDFLLQTCICFWKLLRNIQWTFTFTVKLPFSFGNFIRFDVLSLYVPLSLKVTKDPKNTKKLSYICYWSTINIWFNVYFYGV